MARHATTTKRWLVFAALSTLLRAACAGAGGATGAELSGADAGFLVREAARGDELRAGLDACYAVIDGVRQ